MQRYKRKHKKANITSNYTRSLYKRETKIPISQLSEWSNTIRRLKSTLIHYAYAVQLLWAQCL